MATEHRSTAFRGSLSHCPTSPIAGSHISLYVHVWCLQMHNSIRSSFMIFHVVANNSNFSPGQKLSVFLIFGQMLAFKNSFTWKFLTQKFSDTKIFWFTVYICVVMIVARKLTGPWSRPMAVLHMRVMPHKSIRQPSVSTLFSAGSFKEVKFSH